MTGTARQRFKDKTVVVAGGTSGIGLATRRPSRDKIAAKAPLGHMGRADEAAAVAPSRCRATRAS